MSSPTRNEASREPQARRNAHFRNLIALTMLLVASLGAGVAGWTAIKQQSSSSIERRLTQAQMLELGDRMQLVEFSRAGKAMQDRLEQHLADARHHAGIALRLETEDPARSRLSDLDAQEALLLANVVRPFVDHLPNIIQPDSRLDERRIGLSATVTLQRRGFQASWIDSGDQGARIDYSEKTLIDSMDDQVLALSLVVVMLVLGLALLTLADLSVRHRAICSIAYGAAVVASGAGILRAVSVDSGLIAIVGGVTAVFALFVVCALALGWLAADARASDPLQPQTIDTQGFAGGQLQVQDASGRFSRALVASISMAALASAVIGYWYVEATSRADDAAMRAYQQQLEFVKRAGRASAAVLGTFEAMANLYERRQRCTMARERALLARDGRIELPASLAAAQERSRCDRLADAAWPDGMASLLADVDRRFGPAADSSFPQRLHQHAAHMHPGTLASEAMALWDGYVELMSFWNAKTTSYLASLTIVAIALYLFGQALGMGRLGVTRAMAVCGAALTLVATGWSLIDWRRALPSGSLEAMARCEGGERLAANAEAEAWMQVAASNYAKGAQILSVARSPQEFEASIAALECAVAARPNLELAHNDLAGAKAISESAHKGQAYHSLPSKERLDEIERNASRGVDIQRRLSLAPSSYALNTHAVALWGLGIRDGKLDMIQRALDLVGKGVEMTEALEESRRKLQDASRDYYPWLSILPLLYLNQGLFLIAVDRIEDGKGAVEKALALRAHRDWTLAGTMVTATSLLYSNCERLHPAERCAAIRTALAGYRRALMLGNWNEEDGSTARRINRVVIAAGADNIAMLAHIPDFDASKDRLAAIWSVTDPQWGVLDALTFVSPPIASHELRKRGEGQILFERDVLAASGHRRCMSGARYTAELYLNGQPAGSASTERKGVVLQASRHGRLNISVCHPEGWQAWQPAGPQEGRAQWSTQPVAGLANAAGEPAAFLFSFPLPRAGANGATPLGSYATDRALELLENYGVVSAPATSAKARLATCDKVGKGGIAMGSVTARSGIAHVVLVLADALDGANACDVVRSVTVMHGLPG